MMEGNDAAVPSIIESQGDEKIFRRNWARLIQKIYEVDPLVCPKCKGAMRIIGSIEDPSVIRAILDHLGIYLVRSRRPLLHLPFPSASPAPAFRCKTSFDKQKQPLILRPLESNVLSNLWREIRKAMEPDTGRKP